MRKLEFMGWEGDWGDKSCIGKEDSTWLSEEQLLKKEQLLGHCELLQCWEAFTFHPE